MTWPSERLDRLASAAREALEGYREFATELGARTFETESDDGTVRVTATLHGRIVGVRLLPRTVSRVDRFTLGELVTATCQAAQAEASQRYQEELAAALPPEYAEYQQLMASMMRG